VDSRSVSSETTFPQDVDDDGQLEEALLAQVVDASGSLRGKDLFARTVTVKLRFTDFSVRSRSRTLDSPVQTERAIFAVARQLLGELRSRRGGPVRLIGVGLTNLDASGENVQGRLLDLAPPPETERDRTLAEAADRLRRRFGRDAVQPGRLVDTRRRGSAGR